METTAKQPLDVLTQLLKTNESRFLSLVYRKKNGELGKYLLHLNVNLRTVYERDLAILSKVKATTMLASWAKRELIASLRESLETNFHNSRYTKAGYYTHLAKSVKYNDKGQMYFNAFVVSKTVLEAVSFERVNSAPETIAKNRLRKLLKSNKFREFRIDMNQLKTMKINGNVISINAAL
jgi:hypothetical protein